MALQRVSAGLFLVQRFATRFGLRYNEAGVVYRPLRQTKQEARLGFVEKDLAPSWRLSLIRGELDIAFSGIRGMCAIGYALFSRVNGLYAVFVGECAQDVLGGPSGKARAMGVHLRIVLIAVDQEITSGEEKR